MDVKRTAELAGVQINEETMGASQLSALIKKLEEIKKEHGDMMVGERTRQGRVDTEGVTMEIVRVNAYGRDNSVLVFGPSSS